MELQHLISHPHPLLFHEVRSDPKELPFYCSGCEEGVSGPCFSCEECGFFLHEKCAEAPVEIDHPFHPDHHLILRQETVFCQLCGYPGKGFFYGCSSCEFYLDINCGLLPRDTNGNFIKIRHVAHQHPLVLIANSNNHLHYRFGCLGCSSRLTDASYSCFECRIFFHKDCVELPIEINHPYHRKHHLNLELERELRDCNLCESKHRGLFYCCSLCSIHIHSKCVWPPSIIEDKDHHEHSFTLQLRPNSFTCDACGTQSNKAISYSCSTCHLQVHKKCISLPRVIRINLDHHPIYHNFFLCLHQHDSKTWDCRICYQEVNLEYGSYYCSRSDCDFVIHIGCAMKNRSLYDVIQLKNQDEVDKYNAWIALYSKSKDCITCVVEEINIGEDVIAAEIIHISHDHNLTFSSKSMDNKLCNGCVLPILPSFYYCSQCNFFLHKTCAELPREKLLWLNKNPFTLQTNSMFECQCCQYHCSGFSYKFGEDDDDLICLRCAALSHSLKYQAHEAYHIFFDRKYRGPCSACGSVKKSLYFRNKDCDFALDVRCLTLPKTVWHKCDEHSLILAYGDDNDYPLQHYCDICEERRDPKFWFYHCKDCDTTVHPKCVLGKYSFIKSRSNYIDKNHPHPLTFVRKIYDYPQCVDCGKPCVDLSLECAENGCNYVVHWECITPFYSGHRDWSHDNDSDSDIVRDSDSDSDGEWSE